jgi:tetratricopeptide (TPR) repeat protein
MILRRTCRVGLRRFAGVFALCLIVPTAAFAHGDLHERITAVTTEIRDQPNNAVLYLKRGELHGMHEEWAQAEADFDKAEKLDAKLINVSLARSRVLLARKRFKDAQAEVERYLSAQPKHSAALIIRAQAQAGQKQFAKAAETWAQVIETADRSDVEPYYERARALVAVGSDQTDAALKTLDEGLAKLGKVPALGLYAIQLEVARKRYDAALNRLDDMIPKTGRKETWLELRGDILASAGRKDESQKTYAKALEELQALPTRVRSTKASIGLEERLKKKVGEEVVPRTPSRRGDSI